MRVRAAALVLLCVVCVYASAQATVRQMDFAFR